MSLSPGRRGPRPGLWWGLAALVTAALAGTGFVHRTIEKRRTHGPGGWAGGRGADGWRASFWRMLDEARDARWQPSVRHSRSARRTRRERGKRYGRHVKVRRKARRYVFQRGGDGGGGQGGGTALSAEAIRRTLQAHDDRLGACLIQHGAKSVHIQLDVEGTGRITAVDLDVSGAAATCVRRVLDEVRFPRHPGGRTHGEYRLRLQ
jgi:hypothetical protein